MSLVDMTLLDTLFPQPWRVVEGGALPRLDYTVKAANGAEVAFYCGPDAVHKANAILELASRRNVMLHNYEIRVKAP